MTVILHECLSFSEASVKGDRPRVDREKGIIYGVKALGWKSLNGREYDPAGVDPALYEGRGVCADHVLPGQTRSTRDTVGWLEGCTKDSSATGGIYAERLRLLNPKGEYEQKLMTAAESAPHLFGLSHTAKGREKAGSYGSRIEAVEHVDTVDVVRDPATVAGLYESRNPPVKKKWKELAEALKATRPGYAKALREMAEAGVLSPDAAMDAPPDEAAADEPADHKQALMDALKALCDEADTLDEGELLKKFKAILKLIKGGNGDTPDDPAATEESRRLKTQNAALLAEKLVRKAAGKAGVSLSETLVEAVARPGMTEAQAAAVVDELKGAGGSQRPRSAGPVTPPAGGSGKVQEGKGGATEIPADPKARAAWLKRG